MTSAINGVRPTARLRAGTSAGSIRDATWKPLFTAGGIAALLFLTLTLVSVAALAVTPQPPRTGQTGGLPGGIATLQYIGDHKAVYLLNMILFVGPVSLSVVMFPALFVALREVSKSAAAIGGVIGILSVVLCISPLSLLFSLVQLSDEYAAAVTSAGRASIAATADGLLAQINTVSLGGVLYAVGVLVISVAMLRGVFYRGVAYLGILTGVIGIVCESLRPVMGTWYGIYGVMLIWLLAVGWKLLRLGRAPSVTP